MPTPRPHLLPFTAGVALLLAVTAAPAAVVQVGNVTGVNVTTNTASGLWTASFALSTGGSVEITPYAPDLVRVDFHWVGPFATEQIMIEKPADNWSAFPATLTDQGTHYLIETSELDIEVEKTPYRVHFKDKGGYYLLRDDFTEYDDAYTYTGQSGNTTSKLKCRKTVPSSQAFFGLGEHGGPMNRRGLTLECWNTGTYNWGEYTNPTYLNVPFFYGLQPAESGHPAFVYGLFFHNPCRPKFRFGTEASDKVSFQAGDGRMDYFFFGGGATHTMAKVIDRYSELTGRPTMLPRWGLGYHLSRFSYSNQSWVEYIADEAGNQDIPLDAVYLDIDYMDVDADNDISDGLLRQLTFNGSFPNPAGMISYCTARGVNVIPLIEPWLEPGDPLHTEANDALHFIKDNGGTTVTRGIYVGNVSWFDYTSPSMQAWWQGKILNWMSALDFAGIWNDLTEPEGGDSIPHDGLLWLDGQYGDASDSRRHWSNEHNYFGIRASRQSYNTMLAKDPNKRPFILGRSGNAGLQRYAVSWSGDTAANWFYHQKTIRFGMGAMIAGVAWYGNDVGGFAGSPDGELMVRSTEANFLTPFFRNHGDKSAADREPWRFSDPYRSEQRDLIKLRYRLMPYLYTLAYQATQTGEPMNVPPAFDYYADNNTLSLNDYEYLVGDFILCAPVYSQGANSRTVYLPYAPGVAWYYWPSAVPSVQPAGEKFSGGQQVTVSAPRGNAPLFVRSGAIIPMGPSMQHANEFQPGWMDINCWPDGDSEFTLYEDDGETWDFLGGAYAKRRMVSSRTASAWDFTIEAQQGTYDPGGRDFYVYCFNPGTTAVQAVTLDGAALPEIADFNTVTQGWHYTVEGRIAAKLPDTGAEAALRVIWGEVNDTVQFTAPTATVAEGAGSVRLYASRVGAATGAVSVGYATAGGTADSGVDFAPTNATLHWAIGDTADKFFDVLIVQDALFEGDEFFSATLSGVAGADLGSPAVAQVTILEDDPVPPDLLVTNPPAPLSVSATTTAYEIQGLANPLNWSGLAWSNVLTGAYGTAPIAGAWSISGVPLGTGTNFILVTATNVGGVTASDNGSDAAYADGWDAGDNGGVGWGAWQFFASSPSPSENGHFMASAATVDIGTPAWGLYANSGNLSEAKRPLLSPLTPGQAVAVRFDNGSINTGSGVGVALQNASGTTLWEFFFNGGDTFYSMSGSTTDVGWTSSGLDIEFLLTGPSNYLARVTPPDGTTRTNTGALIASANSTISVFRAWNYNAGGGSSYDVFFNDLTLHGASAIATGVMVEIVRASGSQIPQAWRDQYGLTGEDDDDDDNDGATALEEYLADTVPTNGDSFFGFVAVPDSAPPSNGVLGVDIMAPTTNSRIYGLSYASNTTDGAWWPLGIYQAGRDDGGALRFTVTNATADHLFYRSHVGTSARIGQQAEFVTRFHSVSGTATIVNGHAVRVDNFYYDGTGIDVHVIVSPNSSFAPYTAISGDLLNPGGYSNATLNLALPPDLPLDSVAYISIWCVPVGVSFGDGQFL